MHLSSDQLGAPLNAGEIRHMALIATLINHPDCFDEIGEALGTLAFSTQELDILRQQVLNTLAERSGLDSAGLITHLNQSGFAKILGRVLSPHVYGHGFFARPNTDRHAVLSGWKDALKMFRNDDLAQEILGVLTEGSNVPEAGNFYVFVYKPKTPGIAYDEHPLVAVTDVIA